MRTSEKILSIFPSLNNFPSFPSNIKRILRWSDAVWRHSFPIGVFLAEFWFCCSQMWEKWEHGKMKKFSSWFFYVTVVHFPTSPFKACKASCFCTMHIIVMCVYAKIKFLIQALKYAYTHSKTVLMFAWKLNFKCVFLIFYESFHSYVCIQFSIRLCNNHESFNTENLKNEYACSHLQTNNSIDSRKLMMMMMYKIHVIHCIYVILIPHFICVSFAAEKKFKVISHDYVYLSSFEISLAIFKDYINPTWNVGGYDTYRKRPIVCSALK